jgi:hypothetical protein
MQHHKGTG